MTSTDYEPTPEQIAAAVRRKKAEGWAQSVIDTEQSEDGAAAWEIVTASDVAPEEAAGPTILEFAPGQHALYAGQLHWLYGDNDSAKTWIGLLAIMQQIRSGGVGLVVEYEMTAASILRRLAVLGATSADLRRCVIVRPASSATDAVRRRLAAALEPLGAPSLVLVDSAGAALSRAGLDSNRAGDIEEWVTEFPRWAIDQWGAAVVVIDHTPHDGKHATGSKRKGDTADAVFSVVNAKRIARHEFGHSTVTCEKDREGFHPYGRTLFVLEGGDGQPFAFRAPSTSEAAPRGRTDQAAKIREVVAALPLDGRIQITKLRERVGGTAAKVPKIAGALVAEGVLIRDERGYGRGPQFEEPQ